MYALFLSGDDFIKGFKETTQEESETFEIKFVIVDSLPTELTSNRQENTLLKWDVETETVTIVNANGLSPSDAKIAELNSACNAAILAGFTSSALGTPHTYDFDYEAQTNIGGIFSAIIGGIVTTPQQWKASGVPTLHTTDQLKQLFADGILHKNTNIGKYWTLKAQALAAQTPQELAAIVW